MEILPILISAVAALVALGTLIKAIVEYKRSAAAKRFELFLAMRARLRQNNEFAEICELLEAESEELRSLPLEKKDRFAGFFEELAIMRNSGILNDDVALYMFGYWAIRCNRSEHFWHGLNREQALWSLFFDFANEMEDAHRNFQFDPKRYHLR